MSILTPGLAQQGCNEVGTPAMRLLPWGRLCPRGGNTAPQVVILALEQALKARGLDPIVDEARKAMQGHPLEAQLAILEEHADPFLPTGGELFTWNGGYGVFWGGLTSK